MPKRGWSKRCWVSKVMTWREPQSVLGQFGPFPVGNQHFQVLTRWRLWLLNCEKRFTKKDYDIRCEFFTLNVLQYHTLWRQFDVWPHMTSIQHFASFLGKSQFSSENFGRWNMNRYDTLTYDINYMVGPVTGGKNMWFQPFSPSWPGNSTTLEISPQVTRGEVPRDWLDKFVSWWRWTSVERVEPGEPKLQFFLQRNGGI